MKKLFVGIFFIFMLSVGCNSNPTSLSTEASVTITDGKTLDRAIAEASIRIEERIAEGTKVAPINFNSSSDRFSTYVLDELTANLVENGKIIVVNRSEIDLIRNEFDFQSSGEVADDSMQTLGRMLGAQSIITGSLTDMGGFYRIVIRVLNVQNASVEVQYRANIINDMVVSTLLTGGRTTATAIASGSGQQARTSQSSTLQSGQTLSQQPSTRAPTYRIGDTGPAGGIIFYDKGIFSNGWRYLEAAPADYEFQAQWGLWDGAYNTIQNVLGKTSTDIGRGKTNTETLVLIIRQHGELDRAAELCTILEINGYNDWFLPSNDELNLMYTNLKQRSIGNFKDNVYWSSSLSDIYFSSAFQQNFSNGEHNAHMYTHGRKINQEAFVRAIRQF